MQYSAMVHDLDTITHKVFTKPEQLADYLHDAAYDFGKDYAWPCDHLEVGPDMVDSNLALFAEYHWHISLVFDPTDNITDNDLFELHTQLWQESQFCTSLKRFLTEAQEIMQSHRPIPVYAT